MACIVIYYCNNTTGYKIRIKFNNYFFRVFFSFNHKVQRGFHEVHKALYATILCTW